MPRDGSNVYSKPAGTTASPNTTIESAKFNSVIDDIASDLNAARPITAGGTGATTAAAARTAMGIAWEKVAESTPSAATSINFVDLSAYRAIRVSGYLLPDTDNVALWLRTSRDNGSSYDSGASHYAWQYDRGAGSTTTAGADSADGAFAVSASTAVGNAANEGVHFVVEMMQFNQAAMTRIISWSNEIIVDGTMVVGMVGGRRLNAEADNAFRMLFSSGNIASGYVLVEGAR